MTRLARGARTIQAPPPGWRIPFGVTVLPTSAARGVMSKQVSKAISKPGGLVMARTTAGLRRAAVGDVMSVYTSAGAIIDLRIRAIVPDDEVGGTELVISPRDASRIGLVDPGRVVIWKIPSRTRLDAALRDQGLVDSAQTGTLGTTASRLRIRRSWDPVDPDASLGTMQVKAALGEFAVVIRDDSSVSISQSWIDSRMDCGPINYCRRLLNPDIPVRARCHRDILPALEGALRDVAAEGLAWTIDVGNANTYGGCFYPRFNRLATSRYVGFLSRHTWGMAFDTNTTSNAQGATPGMDCRTVRIFRKWGFGWGGNYLTPDGMHFEWIGAPRHRMPYPSKYCPNDVPRSARSASVDGAPAVETQRSTLFSQDGMDANR